MQGSVILQIGLDQQDQNKAQNKAGDVLGNFASAAQPGGVSDNALAPYDEVFGLGRFRENELIHGRWAMLATLGAIIAEASTGVSWCGHNLCASVGHTECSDGVLVVWPHGAFAVAFQLNDGHACFNDLRISSAKASCDEWCPCSMFQLLGRCAHPTIETCSMLLLVLVHRAKLHACSGCNSMAGRLLP